MSRTQLTRAHELGRNMTMSMFGNIAAPAAAFISAPILARAVGVEGRGEVAASTAPLMFLVVVATFGLPEAATYFIARNPSVVPILMKRAALIVFASGVLGAIALVGLADVLAGAKSNVGALIGWTAVALIPSVLVGLLRGAAAGLHKWKAVNAEKYINAGLRLAATAAFAAAGLLSVELAVVIAVCVPIVAGFAYVSLLVPRAAANDVSTDSVTTRGMLSYGSRMWFGALSGILLSRLDQVLMNPLAGSAQLGLYAVAVNVADVTLIANSAVRDVTLASDAADRADSRLTASARVSLLGTCIVGIGVGATLPFWLPLLFGESFSGAISSAEILILAAVLGAPGSVAGAALSARGRPELRSASLIFAALVNTSLLLLTVPAIGALGAAVATLAGSLIAANANIVAVRVLFGVPISHFYLLRQADFSRIARLVRSLVRQRGKEL